MHTINDNANNIVGERYASFAEFYQVNEARQLNAHYRPEHDNTALDPRSVSDGMKCTWAESKLALMYGTDLYSEQFRKALIEARRAVRPVAARHERILFQKDLVGQSVLVERALVGHPKSFSRRSRNRTFEGRASLLFSISCPWATTVEERVRSGCMVLAVVEALEAIGCSVEITLLAYAAVAELNTSYPATFCEISLKRFGERLNPRKLEYAVAAKATLFHAGCWWLHRFPSAPCNYGRGEGYAID